MMIPCGRECVVPAEFEYKPRRDRPPARDIVLPSPALQENVVQQSLYDAYGAPTGKGSTRSAYTGQVVEKDTGWYLLGERPYNPIFRRFLAPDALSPFGDGGLNRYTYCGGDPINRIDPNGQAWRDVIRRLMGKKGRSGNAPSAAATPAMASQAASTEVVWETSSSTERLLAPTPKKSVMGAVAADTGTGPADIALAPGSRLRDGQWFGQHSSYRVRDPAPRERVVYQLQEPSDELPLERLKTNKRGEPSLKKSWTVFQHQDNPAAFAIVADTRISVGNLKKLYRNLRQEGITETTIFAGAHGRTSGDNWDTQTGKVRSPDKSVFLDAYAFARDRHVLHGENVRVADLANFTAASFREALAQSGVNIVLICYGIADRPFMEAYNLREVTVLARRAL